MFTSIYIYCVPRENIESFLQVQREAAAIYRLSRFRDRAHHDQVMAQVDTDDGIGKLYEKVTTLLDIERVIRGEFERVV